MASAPDQLKPHDFPVEADKARIKRHDGTPIAETDSDALAHDIAERLNSEEALREQDKWSA